MESLLKKIFALVAGTVVLVLGFMFSMVVLAAFVVLGLAGFAFFWWKTRKLRQEMKQRAPQGNVIDGEAVVVDEHPTGNGNILPGERTRL